MDENTLIREHAQLVYNLSLRLVGNPTDAEDLAQDALLRAVRALPQFRGDSKVTTWLYRITVNTWKNRVRAEKSRGLWNFISFGAFTKDEEKGDREFPSHEPPVDANLVQSERNQRVQKALLKLDEESRAVIVLRDLHDKSYKEIADVLGIPEGTVKSRISRARESLKKILKESFSEENL